MNLESNKTNQSEDPMCVMCKKFFGNQAFGRMCSQCYKKHGPSESMTAKQQSPIILSTPTKQTLPEIPPFQNKKEVNKDRCQTCNRKLRLLGVECRCGAFYCNAHRLPEDHSCTFNHKTAARQKLTKQIIKVQNGKIQSI